ncbi:MAG TPA: hypothetical protein VGP93_08175 [Polyangiaceae bacterium]|nr:hypothetical protein [Polyangiaceae bacterium]
MNFEMVGKWFARGLLSSCLVLGATLGCGSSKPAPAKTPVPEAKESPREPLEEPIDLSPVAAPPDLVLVGRLSRPLTVVDTVARWAGLPVSVRQLLPPDVKWAESVIAWDAPIQLAGVVDGKQGPPEVSAVVSVGLTSLDAAVAGLRQQGLSLRRAAPGVFQITGEQPSCAVAAARGQAPARLVCGESFRQVERLLPYATRGLPDTPAGKSDLEIELMAEPLQRMYAQQLSSLTFLSGFVIRELSIDHPAFDRALADAVYALAGELQVLAVEIDRARLEAKLDEAGSAVDLGLSIKLRAEKSWTGQLLAEAAQRSTTAPEAFWQLPDQATDASYANAVDPEHARGMARTLADLADGYLDKEKVGRGARDRVKAAIVDLFALSAATAGAHGQGAILGKDPTLEQRVAAIVGWRLFVIDGPAAPYLRVSRDLLAVVNDRDLRKFAAKELQIDAKLLPNSSERAFTAKGVPPGGRVFTQSAPAALLEKLSKRELSGLKSPKDKNASLKLVWVVVPDGKKTIVVLAPDEKVAAERIAAFKAGKEPTLAQRPDLGPLRSARAFSAGFASLATFAGQLSSLAQREGGDSQKLLDALPHHGRAAMLTSLSVERGNGTTLRLQLRVQRASVEDFAGLIATLGPKF